MTKARLPRTSSTLNRSLAKSSLRQTSFGTSGGGSDTKRVDTPQIVPVDERDSGWEDTRPRFRVYFQRARGSYIGGQYSSFATAGPVSIV
jgi:hypothetical protein